MSTAALEVWLVDLAAAAPALEAVEARHPRLSHEDHERVARLADPGLRRERRLSTIALRIAITRAAGDGRYDRRRFVRTVLGKPYLEGSSIAFNVSHAGGFALLAVAGAGDAALGVDIEAERDLRMSKDRMCRVVEAALALGGEPSLAVSPLTPALVLQSWVRIEAAAKATGLGLARVLTHFGVIGRRDDEHRHRADVDAAKRGSLEAVLEGLALLDLDLARIAPRPLFAAIAAPRALLVSGCEARAFPTRIDDIASLSG